jgi:hypothetical protein
MPPPLPAARLFAPLAFALPLLLPVFGCAALGVGGSSASRELAQLDADYVAATLAERPDLASLHGDRRGDGRLEPVTEASLARARGRVGILAERLGHISREALAPRDAARRDSLAAWLAAERAELDTNRWERDPAAYLDLAGHSIERMTGGRRGCLRVQAIARRLTRVPEVLRSARVNLREPPRGLIEAALPGYERLLGLYRVTLPGFAAPCRDANSLADLAEADSAAVRATVEFVDYLRRDLLPRAR